MFLIWVSSGGLNSVIYNTIYSQSSINVTEGFSFKLEDLVSVVCYVGLPKESIFLTTIYSLYTYDDLILSTNLPTFRDYFGSKHCPMTGFVQIQINTNDQIGNLPLFHNMSSNIVLFIKLW